MRLRCTAGLAGGVALAWACASPAGAFSLASLKVAPDPAVAGGQVTVTGTYYNGGKPVLLHWDGLDGPVVATLTPDTFKLIHSGWMSISGAFTVPPDAQPGSHRVVATQEAGTPPTWGVPARTAIRVTAASAAAAPAASPLAHTPARPATVAVRRLPGLASLATAGLAGAGAAVLVVAVAFGLGHGLGRRRGRVRVPADESRT